MIIADSKPSIKSIFYWVATPKEIGLLKKKIPRKIAEAADHQFEMKYGIAPVETI